MIDDGPWMKSGEEESLISGRALGAGELSLAAWIDSKGLNVKGVESGGLPVYCIGSITTRLGARGSFLSFGGLTRGEAPAKPALLAWQLSA